MAGCPGKNKRNTTCNGLLYRCKKCGGVGCDRGGDECTNQGFKSGKCKKCGAIAAKENVR